MNTAKAITGFIILLSSFCPALSNITFASSMEWLQIGMPLSPRSDCSIRYNPVTNKVLLFGGNSGSNNLHNDTWEWDGLKWNKLSLTSVPEPRFDHILAYSPARDSILMIGGVTDHQTFEVWEWNAGDWQLIQEDSTVISPRSAIGFAYDPERERAVFYGGWTTDSEPLDELWEWDGIEWNQVTKITPWPPKYLYPALTYNPDLNKVVMLLTNPNNGQMELWYWEGSIWEKPEFGHPKPPQRDGMNIDYDPDRSVLVMFGGSGNTNDTWEWDGTTWREMNPTQKPTGRFGHTITWDASLHRIMLFGGKNDGGECNGETWFYDGSDWTSVASDPFYPPELFNHAMAYHPIEQLSVLYGGSGLYSQTTETFEWNGDEWTGNLTSVNPGYISYHCMSYMASLNGIVLYGGLKPDGPDGFNDQMWLYRDHAWIQLNPPEVPGPRQGASMVYDSVRDRVVLFGGISDVWYDPPFSYSEWSDETWEYDGETWYQVLSTHHPQARVGAGMAFDSCRGVTVLFSGRAENQSDNQTWEYDGIDWTRVTPATTTPSIRVATGFTFDAHRCRTVMHGGVQSINPGFDETWEWDGYDWYLIEPFGGRLAPCYSTAMVYDSARRCSTIYGGGMTWITVETHVYRHSNPDICNQMGVTLDLSQSLFHAGDTFTCTAQVCNNTGDVLTGYPLLVLLDVFGSYFWGPTFTQEFDSYLPQYPSFPEDVTDVEVLPSFSWPSNVGTAQGIRFYAALVDPDVHILIGELDAVSFGWSD